MNMLGSDAYRWLPKPLVVLGSIISWFFEERSCAAFACVGVACLMQLQCRCGLSL